jgi:hypothetical protein
MTPDELQDLFQNTDEMLAWDDFVTQARKALENGQETAMLPTAFLRLVLPDLAADPLHFPVFRTRFNRLCDEQGMPGEKVAEPSSTEEKGEGGEGPF